MKKNTQQKKIQKITAQFFALTLLFIVGMTLQGLRADTTPYEVTWQINSFFSDTYNISELTFVWSGDTGTMPNPTSVLGGNNDGAFTTQYLESGLKTVSVFAEHQGVQISDAVSCSYNLQSCGLCPDGYVCGANGKCYYGGLTVSCAAYTSAQASTPTLYFDPGTNVYWRAAVIDGTGYPTFTYRWSGDASGTGMVSGPYTVNTLGDTNPEADYNTNRTFTSYVAVHDGVGTRYASCVAATKQCSLDADCATLGFPEGTICSQSTFQCVPPDPVFLEPLFINPSVVNQGQQCGLAWEVNNADTCTLYKDNAEFINVATTTSETMYFVDPGTYRIRCQNVLGEYIDSTPVRCLYNPEIREQ